MGDINDDLEKENIEIIGGSPVKGDDEIDAVGGSRAAIDPVTDEDDELDAKELDIPYKDEEESV